MISLRSKLTQSVLNYFLLHEEAEAYVNELARRFELDDGNLARKLKELEREGILQSKIRGRERYYSLNPKFPLLAEYKRIILKTVGFEASLKKVLEDVPGLERASLFGSYAQDKMDVSSDIDLLAVGSHDSIELRKKIAVLCKSIDREINVVNMSRSEYERKKGKDPLLMSIARKKKIVLL